MWVGFLGWGDPLVIGNDNQLQDSCLENPMGREAWWTPVHGVVKSRTRLSTHSLIELVTILLLCFGFLAFRHEGPQSPTRDWIPGSTQFGRPSPKDWTTRDFSGPCCFLRRSALGCLLAPHTSGLGDPLSSSPLPPTHVLPLSQWLSDLVVQNVAGGDLNHRSKPKVEPPL